MATEPVKPKLCLFCTHFYFDPGWGGTDVTPGEPPAIACYKSVWEIELRAGERVTTSKYRERMRTAEACKHWNPCKEWHEWTPK